ncbi:MAG: isoprenylcysteine carboxylmethyltransferase family protein [Ignavibacteriae bacterium]|nr:isoprenylcysteine carboxylmethyltransferase family protein [Ignavibacteria bacterium]MBI3363640.1 isoprenylcysteine carboxylmethyltransferase family protein [Ignavibacteriota bacterium]
MDFRQQLFQYRSYTPIPFLLVMIVLAHPTFSGLLIGLCIVLVGEFIRLWGVAIAGSETRTTGPVGGTFLITRGPFSYVRNPLYLGNILMYFGVGIMSNVPVLAAIALVFFFFQYSIIVNLEEEYLLKTFTDEYVNYSHAVPRFIPTFSKYEGGTHPQPERDWKRGLVSEKRTLQAIVLLTIVLLVIWYVRG